MLIPKDILKFLHVNSGGVWRGYNNAQGAPFC